MRLGTSHPEPHRSWISRPAFPPLGTASRRYWSDSAHEECHFYQYWLRKPILRIIFVRTLCGGQQPNPLQEREVEEAAMPGQPARTRARFRISPGNSPSRIASCHRRHRNHRSASFEICHVFAEPTLGHNVAGCNRKTFPPCAETVEDSTSLWKAEENRE